MMQLDDLDRKATSAFEGYVVRKDLVRTFSRQFPVPEHMDSRERLFLGKQAAALFRLISNVLCNLIVLCEGWAQRIQRSVQAFLTLAEIPQLIAEQQ